MENLLKEKFHVNNLDKVDQYLGLDVKNDKNSNYCILQKYFIEKLLQHFDIEQAKFIM